MQSPFNTRFKSGFAFATIYIALGCVYVVLGLFAAAWIAFDFGPEYLSMVSYVTVPVVGLLGGLKMLFPEILAKFRRTSVALSIFVVASLLPAHVLLINALTDVNGPVKRDTLVQNQAMTIAVQRGGLGFLYSKRW